MKTTREERIEAINGLSQADKRKYLDDNGRVCTAVNEETGEIVGAYEIEGSYFEFLTLARLNANWIEQKQLPTFIKVLGFIAFVGIIFALASLNARF